jgi:hypothetical protein
MRHRIYRRSLFLIATALLVLTPALAQQAQEHSGPGQSPYAGQEQRQIKSLSEEDISELRRGGGWSLAKAAELNGIPGPAHLLELKDQIPLTAEQVRAVQKIFEEMKAEAIAAGARLIAAEAELDQAFANRTITLESLRALLSKIEAARTELRFIHLSRHLSTPALLSETQIARYRALRGYTSDPCSNVPAGHDAVMWKLHNGCK